MTQANLYSLAFIIPTTVVQIKLYQLVWGQGSFRLAIESVGHKLWLFILTVILGIIMHEAIHGLAWAHFGKKPFNKIKFGVNLKALSPYSHCTEPLTVKTYRLGAILPGLLIGVVPYLIGLISGIDGIMIFGLIFTAVAGGDALIVWMLRKENPKKYVLDHPEKVGCIVTDENKEIENSTIP